MVSDLVIECLHSIITPYLVMRIKYFRTFALVKFFLQYSYAKFSFVVSDCYRGRIDYVSHYKRGF